ncbi:MAG: hypothetical protein FJ220_00175 [Kiritimatiellaceae bacterium]|nr:hypothetical protein [Kiritimatiellaceae bacterium]
MNIQQIVSACILGAFVTTGMAQVETNFIIFTGGAMDKNWYNPNNWSYQKFTGSPGVPDTHAEVRVTAGASLDITNAVTVEYFKNGCEGRKGIAGNVMIDGGILLATGTTQYNSVCFNRRASLTVKNGGSATFNTRLVVGFKDCQGGSLVIHDGSIRVVGTYYHQTDYTGTEAINTRTTIHTGGLLDVNDMILNAGVVDIAGGVLLIRGLAVDAADQWVSSGRIIAMNGIDGWQIKVSYDEETGWTKLTAEQEPILLGQNSPAPEHKRNNPIARNG